MLNKKMTLWIGMMLVVLISLAACTPTDEGQNVEQGETKPEEENTAEQIAEHGSEGRTPPAVADDPVDSFMHIHGLSYDRSEAAYLYMSTHHGLIQINSDLEWNWVGDPDTRHDFMGFTIQDDQTMISSGHPVEGSSLKNPLGVVISKDYGQSWEPIALYGEVDFHIFEVNASDSSVLYGVYSHGANAGIYRSKDGGYDWEKLSHAGLPNDLSRIYGLVSNPENPENLIAGTQDGILESTDGGQSWTTKNTNITFTSAKGGYGSSGKIVAYLLGENEGLMLSEDFGVTWTSLNLKLEEDAVMHIAIHPHDQGIYTVGTFSENVLQTTDGGKTWNTLAESGKPVR